MKILVTGATGYIGSAVVDELLAANHHVVALVKNSDSAKKLSGKNVTPFVADLLDSNAWSKAVSSADGVIHAANTNNQDAPKADETAVKTILTALKGSQKPFIYTSGIWALGNTGNTPVDETAPLKPIAQVAYRVGIEKLMFTATQDGIRTIVIRPAVVYGKAGGLFKLFFSSAQEHGIVRYVGDGNNLIPVVYVEDLARLYRLALTNASAETVFYAASRELHRLREYADAASIGAGIPGKTASWPLDEAKKTLGIWAEGLTLNQCVTADKAKTILHWEHTGPSAMDELTHGSYSNRNYTSTPGKTLPIAK